MERIMMDLAPYIKILEALSFVAAIALVFISTKALSQINVAKRSLKTQSIRESRRIASDYVYIYLDKIMKVEREIIITSAQENILKNFAFSAKGDEGLDVEEILKNNEKLKLSTKEQREKYSAQVESAFEPYSSFLNDLEAFCSGVTSGVMDERTLYRAVGLSFVGTLESKNIYEAVRFMNHKYGYYQNVVQVFNLWRLRNKVEGLEKLSKQHSEVGDSLDDVRKKLKNAEKQTIPVIGVDLDGR